MKNRLRVLRAERNWSQADLAERLEVSRQSVNAIETGKFDPSLPLAFRLARRLRNHHRSDLLRRSDDRRQTAKQKQNIDPHASLHRRIRSLSISSICYD